MLSRGEKFFPFRRRAIIEEIAFPPRGIVSVSNAANTFVTVYNINWR